MTDFWREVEKTSTVDTRSAEDRLHDELSEVKKENAKLRAELERHKHSLAGTMLASIKADAIRAAASAIFIGSAALSGEDYQKLNAYADKLERGES